MGRAVLPAVHALAHLAEAVGRVFPDVSLLSSEDIHFDKFLMLPAPDVAHVAAYAELGISPDGKTVDAVLLTRHVALKSGMTRMKVHVRARFGASADVDAFLPEVPIRRDTQAEAYLLPLDRLYAEMVPFGKAFQNVVSPVRLLPEGARGTVSGSALGTEDRAFKLGSPFPLDAAFHIACAWAQRYAGVVAFPVDIQKRVIQHQILPGQEYLACVRFNARDGDRLIFDLWLRDRAGTLCEIVQGLGMRDVSSGKLRPPNWIHAHSPG